MFFKISCRSHCSSSPVYERTAAGYALVSTGPAGGIGAFGGISALVEGWAAEVDEGRRALLAAVDACERSARDPRFLATMDDIYDNFVAR